MTCSNKEVSPTAALPYISVVVIGRNEGERLVCCLESVRAADYPAGRIELIYVDTESTDDSCAVADKLGAKVICIKPKHRSAAAARNAGLSVASHDLIHFLDGDTIVAREWLGIAVAALEDSRIACVFGRREEMYPRASLYMRVASLDWHVSPGPARYCGGDALFRRAVLEKVGGFDESFIAGEEPELCYRIRRLGLLIWRCDQPMTRHDLNMTRFSQYWRRGVRSGWAYFVVWANCRAGSERLWLRRNAANLVEVSLWLGLLLLGALLWQWWGVALPVAMLLARTVWIASRVRHRAGSWGLSLLYGLNCQVVRIPVLVGQCRGLWYLVRRRPARLIEYKD